MGSYSKEPNRGWGYIPGFGLKKYARGKKGVRVGASNNRPPVEEIASKSEGPKMSRVYLKKKLYSICISGKSLRWEAN